MEAVWITLGVALLVVTLLDVFLAVLNYDENGLIVDKFVRVQWLVLRAFTRRAGRRWRPMLLRQVTGTMLVTTILCWLTGIILGFALIYYGAIGLGVVQIRPGVEPDFTGALYFSVGLFSTVGVDNIAPGTWWLNLLTATEAMLSIILLSLIITFLSSVYDVARSLRALSGNFFSVGKGIGDAVDTLYPFFPDGAPRGLDAHLGSVVDDLSDYAEGLAQNQAAYYFQSGRDQFSLPFALHMTAGVIGALTWGLPPDSDPPKEPNLARLTQAYEEFRLRLMHVLGLPGVEVPAPVTPAAFAAAAASFEREGSDAAVDAWVLRFLAIDTRMAELTRRPGPFDPAEAYRRYTQWLPFEVPARAFTNAVARDLDYQPVYRPVATTPQGVPLDSGDADPSRFAVVSARPGERRPLRLRRRGGWLRRRHLVIDPGFVRLAAALRAMAGAALAVGVTAPLAAVAEAPVVPAVVFAGMVSVYAASSVAANRSRVRWWTGAVPVLPAVIGALFGTLLPHHDWWSVLELAAIAGLCAWLRRFGARIGGLGVLAFVTYYMALLMGLNASDLVSALIAAVVGIAASWLVSLVPGPGPARQVEGGVNALYARAAQLIEVTTDLVATGRSDRRLGRALRRGQVATVRTAVAVAGLLDVEGADSLSPGQISVLRVRVFDFDLAVTSLVTLLPVTTSITIATEQRARLTADLLALQRQLGSYRPGGEDESPPQPAPPDRSWPLPARRILSRITELRVAASALRAAQLGEVAPDDPVLTEPPPASRGHGPAAAEAAAQIGDRRAVQAAVSTGLALLLGGALSTTSHQYWAAMPAFQVLAGSDGETRVKGIERVLATVAGSGFAFGLAIIAGHNPFVAIPLLMVSTFFMAFTRAVSSPWTSFWQTILLATMYDLIGILSVGTVELRLAETAIGSLVAIAVSALVLPTRTRAKVLDSMASIVGRQAALARTAFATLLGQDSRGRADLALTGREISQALNNLETVARPVRRDPGSLESGGIETQLSCLWATLAYAEHLARLATEQGVGTERVPWRKLSLATADNFEAAQTALLGALPRRVHGPETFEVADAADLGVVERSALLQAERLNQSLLELIDALGPATVASMADDRSGQGQDDGATAG